MVRAQGKDGHSRTFATTFHGMQNAGGVIHHAVRVNRGPKLGINKTFAHVLGKARAYEEDVCEGWNVECRLRDGYGSLQLHSVVGLLAFV